MEKDQKIFLSTLAMFLVLMTAVAFLQMHRKQSGLQGCIGHCGVRVDIGDTFAPGSNINFVIIVPRDGKPYKKVWSNGTLIELIE